MTKVHWVGVQTASSPKDLPISTIASVRLVPVRVTLVPPRSGPVLGEIDVIVGLASVAVNTSAADVAEEPPGP